MLVLDVFGVVESDVVFDCCRGKDEFLGEIGYFATEEDAAFYLLHGAYKHMDETANALTFLSYHQQSFLGLKMQLYIDNQPKIIARVRVSTDRISFDLQFWKPTAISTNSIDQC